MLFVNFSFYPKTTILFLNCKQNYRGKYISTTLKNDIEKNKKGEAEFEPCMSPMETPRGANQLSYKCSWQIHIILLRKENSKLVNKIYMIPFITSMNYAQMRQLLSFQYEIWIEHKTQSYIIEIQIEAEQKE